MDKLKIRFNFVHIDFDKAITWFICQFGRLELDTEESHPTGCTIDTVSGNQSHTHYKYQQ